MRLQLTPICVICWRGGHRCAYPRIHLVTMKPNTALILIDLQNDYFNGYAYPQSQAEDVLEKSLVAIDRARGAGHAIVLVQHVARSNGTPGPFFNEASEGVKLHPRLLAALPDAPVIQKTSADAFRDTELEATLSAMKIGHLAIAGMMTQNCVTHTAISRAADPYAVTVLADLCSAPTQMVHAVALNALHPLVTVTTSDAFYAQDAG